MFYKIGSSVFILCASILSIFIDKPKGEKLSNTRKVLITFFIMASFTSIIIIVMDHHSEVERQVKDEMIIDGLNRTIQNDSLTIDLLTEQVNQNKLAEKKAQTERLELKKLLEPFEKLALEEYPDLKLEIALQKIINNIKTLEEKSNYLETRNTFKPITLQKLIEVVTAFNAIDNQDKERLNIVFNCGTEDINRENYTNELIGIMKSAGFKKVKKQYTLNAWTGKITSPMVYYCNDEDISLVKQITNILYTN